MTADESATQPEPPRLQWDAEQSRLLCRGDWTWGGLSLAEPGLPGGINGRLHLDTTGIRGLDTAGAVVLQHRIEALESNGCAVDRDGLPDGHEGLLALVRRHRLPPADPRPRAGVLYRIGFGTARGLGRLSAFFAFVGEVAADALPLVMRPHRIRWRQVVGEIDHAGLRALPILGLLVFLTGVVIAYQGGAPLQRYGANIFLVDLLTLTMLREMAPLMTAIIVAGRTGSAYTAQIGTMRITEEVDALRVIGITPYEMLVLPKLLALLVAMPLLTIFADILGMLGGITVAGAWFGVGATEFIARMPEAIAPSSFWVGIIKAPVFAILITLVSCYHGFCVQGSTESVGRATTQSVVQGIFLVIVADAVFSVVFNLLKL
ncbi:ABC transporter permease [Aquisalimonas lutea]|uniref:MlaE family ABC transporter permease n=1 Tax=Aquisalimonas lutea TaxID=1327750 RepID=UPI0025B2D69B|nr:ABC transporter permease [Aquisalimonas lutea]MDN3518658.1 ABC transporter permease [Aquisalimonas lutea]